MEAGKKRSATQDPLNIRKEKGSEPYQGKDLYGGTAERII